MKPPVSNWPVVLLYPKVAPVQQKGNGDLLSPSGQWGEAAYTNNSYEKHADDSGCYFYVQTREDNKSCAAGDTDENGRVRRATLSKWKGAINMRRKFPMNLQLFADPAPAGGTGTEPGAGSAQQTAGATNAGGAQQAPQIDYNKIQQMLDGTLAAKESTALKAYFSQQGLSQQEVEQAIAAFKAERAKNQPDVGVMQTQLTQAQSAAQKARVDAAATMAAVTLGIDAKTIPYVLKMADMSQVVGQDGKINEETLKNALNKVLEDVPALKPQAAGSTGFVQIGTAGANGQQTSPDQDALKRAFGL